MPTVKNIAGPFRLYFNSFDCNKPRHVHVQREFDISLTRPYAFYWLF